jgi:hypothetical protein
VFVESLLTVSDLVNDGIEIDNVWYGVVAKYAPPKISCSDCGRLSHKSCDVVKCFRCGTVGHTRKECTVEQSDLIVSCVHCDSNSHMSHQCSDFKEVKKVATKRKQQSYAAAVKGYSKRSLHSRSPVLKSHQRIGLT